MQLSEVLGALAADEAGGDAVQPQEDWRQGRTLYGGLTSALCVASAGRHVASLPPLRALQIAFVGPATGRVRLVPTLVRRGRSAAFVGVDAEGADGPCARATLTYGVVRESLVTHVEIPAPAVPAPEDCRAWPARGGPGFLVHFEVRFAAGGLPFGGGEPAFAMWVRHRDEDPVEPTVALVAAADVLPPGAAPLHPDPRPMSSMTWSLELIEPERATDWYLLRSASERTADGYSVQSMGCWDATGRCLALGRQTVALF